MPIPYLSRFEEASRAYVEGACAVIEAIRARGHVGLFVGGFVRDLLLGRPAVEIDLATSMPLEEIQATFPDTVAVGRPFGVLVVLHQGHPYTLSVFRTETGYRDGRHPDQVAYVAEFAEDARRRDFTINGLGMTLEGEILDPVGGRADLEAGVIRAIGDPAARVAEDRLRMLRAVRFVAQLGFRVDPETEQAIRDGASEITQVSAERIHAELDKLLVAAHRERAFRMLHAVGLLRAILPEVEAMVGVQQSPEYHPEGDVFEHTARALGLLSPQASLRAAWGLLLHDVGKPVTYVYDVHKGRESFYRHEEVGEELAAEITTRLRFSARDREAVCWLVRHHLRVARLLEMRPARAKRLLADPLFPDLLEVFKADIASTGRTGEKVLAFVARERGGAVVETQRRLITGADLIALGYAPGPAFGAMLQEVQDLALEGRLSTREAALRYVQEHHPLPRGAGDPPGDPAHPPIPGGGEAGRLAGPGVAQEARCPQCGFTMRLVAAFYRCGNCGFKESCCY
ncbi:MAG: HD domain-containing protein [Deltaproteobacteria bacterium]|nr:HD domain-containing protein [Deltaproteobacteria bacterium]